MQVFITPAADGGDSAGNSNNDNDGVNADGSTKGDAANYNCGDGDEQIIPVNMRRALPSRVVEDGKTNTNATTF